MSRLAAGCALALALAGCQGPPAPDPAPPPVPSPDLATRAREAVTRRDWAAAAPLLRKALVARPGDVGLRYDLAVAASHLDKREEAIREFRWIVGHADPDSPEYEAARSWLAETGLLGGARVAASTGAAGPVRPPNPTAVVHVERTGDATLSGRVTWGGEPGGRGRPGG